jgi:hypothetical protein
MLIEVDNIEFHTFLLQKITSLNKDIDSIQLQIDEETSKFAKNMQSFAFRVKHRFWRPMDYNKLILIGKKHQNQRAIKELAALTTVISYNIICGRTTHTSLSTDECPIVNEYIHHYIKSKN